MLTVRNKLEQLETYAQINANKNPVRLLEEIWNIVVGRETHKCPIYSMVQMIKMITMYNQHRDQSNKDYKECSESR